MATAITPAMKTIHDMDKIRGTNCVELAKQILRKQGDNPGKRETEHHLYTKEVQEFTRWLVTPENDGGAGITCDEISDFSLAVYVCDSFTSMSIRPQDKSSLLARYTFFSKCPGRHSALPERELQIPIESR